MLYRPCLIKLVDPDNPEKWEYHLREQELPFFITLAHEFLHALNQLERINLFCFTSCSSDSDINILDFLERIIPMEDFLAKKLGIRKDNIIFTEEYRNLWGKSKFLDEMTVILGSERKINWNISVFIGESSFLQDYYKDFSILSWSHCPVRELEFWQKMVVILTKNYVHEIFANNHFGLNESNIQWVKISPKQKTKKERDFSYINSSDYEICKQNVEAKINKNLTLNKVKTFAIKHIETKQNQIFELLKSNQNIHLLPRYYTTISLNGYKLINLSDEEKTNIDLNEGIFENLKKLLGDNCGFLLTTNVENKMQYYEYKPSKSRYYLSGIKRNQTTCDIINKMSSQNIYYYNGIQFQKLQKLGN